MRIPKRIYGIENELGVALRYPEGIWTELTSGWIAEQYHTNDTCVRPYCQPGKFWHTNGGCTYVDTGEHPEHATPECFLIKDAVLYAKAGEILMKNIFSSNTFMNGSRIILFKNNLGCDETFAASGTYGCHENYLLRGLNMNNTEMLRGFIPFLITRQIIDGAGWWQASGTYLFSQRSTKIEDDIGNSTTTNRPLITLRDTSNDTGSMRRLHLILGDANILDVACFLKLGTTSLVLSLIEGERVPKIDYTYPVTTMKQIACEPDVMLPQSGLCVGKKNMSPWEVQTLYYEAARREYISAAFESEEVRAEMRYVLDLWEQALNALFSRDEKWMLGRLDWATKRHIGEHMLKSKSDLLPAEIQKIRKNCDLLYHNITDREFQERMNKKWADRRLINDRQIEKACVFPPHGTRARMRGLFVASTLSISRRIKSGIDWTFCRDTDLAPPYDDYKMDNPFEQSNNNFIQFLAKCLESSAKSFPPAGQSSS